MLRYQPGKVTAASFFSVTITANVIVDIYLRDDFINMQVNTSTILSFFA